MSLLSVALVSLCCVTVVAGCGASYAEARDADAMQAPASQEMVAQSGMPQSPPEPSPVSAADAYGTEESFDSDADFARTEVPSSSSSKSEGAVPGKGYAGKEPGPTQSVDTEEPLVVYTGFLLLRVKRLLETLDAITKATEARGGYIESLTQRAIVVRVPGKDFDGVMAEFAEFGEVLNRNVKALDVTEQFTDLGARLVVAEEARERLLALLKAVEDVEERLRILVEVKRLTEQIESIKSTLATLSNLVEFFTISIELVPIVEESRSASYQSPFDWVRELSPHTTTLFEGKGDFTLTLPRGFVLFEKDDEFRAQSADTTLLRGAVVENEPLGDARFWSAAVEYEMTGRGERRVKQGTAGAVAYQVFVNEDVKPRFYLVGVAVKETEVFVIEVFFPNEESFAKHGDAAVQALSSFRAE